jgi:chemotaxis protein methyltransferase CheR
VELFGSDLSERALEKARSGLYTQFEVQRGLQIGRLVDHFEKSDEMWEITPRIRQSIRWRRVNLLADLRSLGAYDVILCRYVLSNAVPAVRRHILEGLAGALAPDGRLVLGEGETAVETTEALVPVSGRPGLFAPNPAFRAAA